MKRILCLQDLCCVGRCSLGVITPVLSALGLQVCSLPTALLSTHTGGFGQPAVCSTQAFGTEALAHFAAQGIRFDAIYSGYLAQEAQAALVWEAFRQNPDAFKLVDPAVADDGRLYAGVTPALCAAQSALCHAADLLTPNATEAALLLQPERLPPVLAEDMPPEKAALVLHERFAADIVVTGPVNVWCAENRRGIVKSRHTGVHFPGTGDLFGAVLLGFLLRGRTLAQATERAACFTAKASEATPPEEARFGVRFEPFLSELTKEIR